MTMTEPTEAQRAQLAPKRGVSQEVRREYAVEGVEVRAGEGESSHLVNFYGHASVTNRGYDMYGGPDKGGWTEYVDKGAFKRTLAAKPDVVFRFDHVSPPMARTARGSKPGTMTLAEDDIGLAVRAVLNTRDTNVNNLVVQMQEGNADEMSFAFRVVDQVWLTRDGEEVEWWDLAGVERHIREVSLHRGDVSAVTFGASPFTDAALRSLEDNARMMTEGRDHIDEGDLRAAIAHLTTFLPTVDAAAEEAMARASTEAQYRAFLASHADLL